MVSLKTPIVILIAFIGILFLFSSNLKFLNINLQNEKQQEQQQQQSLQQLKEAQEQQQQQQNRHINNVDDEKFQTITASIVDSNKQSSAFKSGDTNNKKKLGGDNGNETIDDSGGSVKIKIPLNLLNIFPSATVGEDGVVEKLILSNFDPITILFNRPVVELGVISNYSPFTLKCLGSSVVPNGQFRWVTTSIARFDIQGNGWPSNLNCTFSVNSNIRCYDGTRLSTTNQSTTSISFTTPQPTITIQEVISEKTLKFTNNYWNSAYYMKDQIYHEIPPDAIIKFSFNEQLDPNYITKSLVAYQFINQSSSNNNNNNNIGQRKPIPYKVITCPNTTTLLPRFYSEYIYYPNSNSRRENYYLCIEFMDNKSLEVGKFYRFEFKKGTKINDKSGVLKESTIIYFSGLKQFSFDFDNNVLTNVIQKLAIRHGLSKGITSSQLASTISIFPTTKESSTTTTTTTTTPSTTTTTSIQPLQFTSRLNYEDSSFLIHIIGLQYGVNYTIKVSDNKNVTDCWGLPLIGNSWNFTMAMVSSFQISYDAYDFPMKAEKNNDKIKDEELGETTPTIKTSNNNSNSKEKQQQPQQPNQQTKQPQQQDQPQQQQSSTPTTTTTTTTTISPNILPPINDFIVFHQNLYNKYNDRNEICKDSGGEYKISGYPITKSNLKLALKSFINGKNFMEQKPKKSIILEESTSTNFYNSSLDSKSLWKQSGVYLEVQTLGISYNCEPQYSLNFISSTDVGVSVLVSSLNSLGCWITRLSDGSNVKDASVSLYQIVDSKNVPNERDIVLVGGSSKKTSNLGTVDFKINSTNTIVVVEYDGGSKLYIAKTDSVLYSYNSLPFSKRSAAVIVTDRKLYNAGEKIDCKIYMNGDYNKYRFKLSITWTILNSVSEFSQEIDVDDDYGTSNLTIDIPDQVSMGPYSILIQGKDTSDSGSDVYFYGNILISDPRIPSGLINIKQNKRFIQLGSSTGGSHGNGGSESHETSFNIQTTTYLGTPLPNKNVTIVCNFDRNSIDPSRSMDYIIAKSITTDNSGFAKLSFNFTNILLKDGDIFICSGSYLDSTGSLIKEDPLYTYVLTTEYRLEVQAEYTTYFGYPSSASASLINQTSGLQIPNITIELKLISTDSSIDLTSSNNNNNDFKVVKNSIFNIWDKNIPPIFDKSNALIIGDLTSNKISNEILKNSGTSCRFKSLGSNGGSQSNCYVILPPSSLSSSNLNYYILATVLIPGNSGSGNKKIITKLYKYDINKKSVFSPQQALLSFNEKDEYLPNETINIRYYNPYKFGQFTLRYGCGNSNTWRQISNKPHGFQTLSIKIPIGCESKKLSIVGVLIGNKYSFKLSDTQITSLTTYDPLRPNPQMISQSFQIKDQPKIDISINFNSKDKIYQPAENVSFTIELNDPETNELINESVEACIMVVDKRNSDIYSNPIANGDQLLFGSLYNSVSDSRFNLIHNYNEMLRVINRILDFDRWSYLYWSKNSDLTTSIANHFQNSFEWLTEPNYGGSGGSSQYFSKGFNGGPKPTAPVGARQLDDLTQSVKSSSDDLPINTNFKTTPLFIGKTIIENGRANIDFKLPDDLTTFIVRVYAITKNHKLYSKESSLISRKDLNMISFSPRFVRTGDKFEAGVSITRIDKSIGVSDLRVIAKYKESCIEFDSTISKANQQQKQDIEFSDNSETSVNIVFPLIAKYQCSAIVYFFLEQKSSGKILNGVTSEFSVLGKQLPLYIGTSFQVKANSTSTEFLSLPESEGGIGSLKLTIGVGNYPIVEEKCLDLLSISKKRLPSSVDQLSQQVTFGALSAYSYNSTLIVRSQQVLESVNDGFYVYTRFNGISWYPQGLPEIYPTLFAVVLKTLMDATNTAGWAIMSNISTWNDFIDLEVNSQLNKDIKSNTSINKELIGLASVGLGYYWAPKDEDLNDFYSFNALTANITDNCSLLCQTYFSLAALIQGESSSPFIEVVVNNLKNKIHIQGRTAYISDDDRIGQSNTNIFDLTTYASILFSLRKDSDTAIILSKMIAFISIGGQQSTINTTPKPYLFGASSQQEALSLIAISFYDKSNKNQSPNLKFKAYQEVAVTTTTIKSPPSHPLILLEYSFTSNTSSENVEKKIPYSSLITNKTVHFSSIGNGEVSVAVGIDYTPVNLPTKPIYNGFYVEKIIQDISGGHENNENNENNNNNNKNNNNSREFYRGQEVMVTLSVTIPDFMNDVFIEDPASGGIEPIDNNIDNSGSDSNPIFYQKSLPRLKVSGYQYDQINNDRLIWFYQPFSHRETRRDKVIYQGSSISPGSYQVSYKCIVTSKGSFTMPPTKVYSSTQPEVFGTSNGFTYSVV
ncbi:hypothetical protein RB653_008152 [Dictyostelium firmibasis]|uniref:Alpha-2-macroglobulin domain-containing protein n=1 Tax=Dictyostelium firmibasis TaxID=79012 RepID=A0AAN7YTS8_9MYCE